MFGQMRKVLGIDNKIDILAYIESLPTPEEKKAANAKVEKIEEDAMNEMVLPQPIFVDTRLHKKDWQV
jgi:hypothetical protein